MALLFTTLLGLGVIVLAYIGYYFAHGHLVHGTEQTIETEIKYLSRMDDALLIKGVSAADKSRAYLLQSADGRIIGGNISVLPDNPSVLAEGSILFLLQNNQRYVARFHSFPDGRRLMVGVNVTDTIKNYNFLLTLSLLSIVLMLAVIAVSFLISAFVVSRTNRIAATAKEIMDTGNLSRRITIDSKWDDISYLSEVLNSFLQRTEELVDGVQRVSDNIAHDLRTPLTRMRNNIDRLGKKGESGQVVEELLAEADNLLATFNALLRITRIETVQQRQNFTKVALHDVLSDVVEFYEPLAEQKTQRIIRRFSDVVMLGDRHLLFQAFANLLDNAIKFSPENSEIQLHLEKSGERVVCSISDQGPGIPDNEKQKVLTRFYRGDSSRHTQGNGLGLSLVAAVVHLHRGSLELSDSRPGLHVKVTF